MKEESRKTVEDTMCLSGEGIREFIRISALQSIESIEPYFLNEDYILINKWLEGDEFYKENALYIVKQLAYSEDFFSELSDDTRGTVSMILSLDLNDEDFEASIKSAAYETVKYLKL